VKYLRYVPNADHSLKGSDAYETLEACYNAVLYDVPLPQFSWTLEKDGAIRITTKDKPSAVKLCAAKPGRPRFPTSKTGTGLAKQPAG